MLQGQMMNRPLSVPAILDYAADIYGDSRVISSRVEGDLHSLTYRDTRRRVKQLANALIAMGVRPGDRVATLAWNGYRHLELYYAISALGAVCHTINPRLFQDQIVWIINHARDSVLFFDTNLAQLVTDLSPRLPSSLHYVALCAEDAMPPEAPTSVQSYEPLLAAQPDMFDWPDLPETTAAGLCYTSGTTGNPKGALYSHRSTVLFAMSMVLSLPESFGRNQTILPVVPMFHVNAWGLPFTAPLSGSNLVMPGPNLDGASLFRLMDTQGVTVGWGVPAVWMGLIEEMKHQGRKPAHLEALLIGGSAVTEAQIRVLERDFGVRVIHGWGMTELSPVGTAVRLRPQGAPAPTMAEKLRQGQPIFGLEMKISDGNGTRLPHDDQGSGELMVRGNTVVSGYYNEPDASIEAFDEDGWFRTGDVARLSAEHDLTIVDRTKDLIKSGGEWISSIDLENATTTCPGVRQVAAIAVPDARWGERPLLVVVTETDASVSPEDIRAHLAGQLAKWQIPEQILFRDTLPLTATGKVSKLTLRQELGNG